MKGHKISALINFCSNDYPFLRECIAGVARFAEEIVISVCDHFFDGTPEDLPFLESIYREHPECSFVQFAYEKMNLYSHHGSDMWHNLGRLIGTSVALKESDYLLFLDTDEIVEEKKFIAWLNSFPFYEYNALRLGCYWYFREPIYRAKSWEDTPLLVKRGALDGESLMHPCEREGIFHLIQGKKQRKVLGGDGEPMIHHYSWVRTEAQMLKKVKTWGQNWRRDWESLVREEFSHPFSGRDFVHGYEFTVVTPYIDLDLGKKISLRRLENKPSNVRYLTTKEIHHIELSSRFNL
jgi:hypothetical protein